MLNSNKNIPLIKYNPGDDTEIIYRLYTQNYYSNEGKKLPTLYVENKLKNYKIKKIMTLLSSTIRKKKLGFYINYNDLMYLFLVHLNLKFHIYHFFLK